MKTHTLLLLFMLTAAAERNLEKRYFGEDCTSKQRLYHVELMNHEGRCAGSLINRRWVLTAAHCQPKIPGSITVTLGAHHSFGTKTQQDNKDVVTVDRQFKHGKGDIMLLRLEKDAPDTFPAIPLPPKGCKSPEIKSDVGLGGYGPYTWDETKKHYTTGGIRPLLLQCGVMRITPCTPTYICYTHGNVDTCFGDSGSAVEYDDDKKNGVKIYGVHSAGHKPNGLCSGQAVATDVCFPQYRDWINTVLTDKLYDPKNIPVGDPDY